MADYDAESDVLYLHVDAPEPAEAEETPEGHAIRYAFGSDRVVGLTMISPRHILEQEGKLMVTLPDLGAQIVTGGLERALVAS
ncbi:MAG TPA: hypothetical protein VE972_12700 [Conexibacter sp.]|nr:hypothetical protein [Conexibacter sp.]